MVQIKGGPSTSSAWLANKNKRSNSLPEWTTSLQRFDFTPFSAIKSFDSIIIRTAVTRWRCLFKLIDFAAIFLLELCTQHYCMSLYCTNSIKKRLEFNQDPAKWLSIIQDESEGCISGMRLSGKHLELDFWTFFSLFFFSYSFLSLFSLLFGYWCDRVFFGSCSRQRDGPDHTLLLFISHYTSVGTDTSSLLLLGYHYRVQIPFHLIGFINLKVVDDIDSFNVINSLSE